MWVIKGQPGKDVCDRNLPVTRRDVLRVGGAAMLGMTLPTCCNCRPAPAKRTNREAPAGGRPRA